jgi:outer membrane autotransporter protein
LSSVAQTPNQFSVANAPDQLPSSHPLSLAVVNQTPAGARQAFDALSGEIHGSAQTVILNDSTYTRQAVLGRLRQAPFSSAAAAGPMAALGSGGPTVADGETNGGDDDSARAFPLKAPRLISPTTNQEFAGWAQGVGAWGKIESDGNAANAHRNLAGFMSGIDRRFSDDWRSGIAVGYSNSNISMSARASSATIDTAHLAAYAGTNLGAWNFRSGAAFSWNTVDASRSILFPSFAENATASYGVGEAQAFGEIGHGVAFGNLAAEPFAGLAYVHLNTGSFTEAGGVSALTGAGASDDVGYSTLGARAAANCLLPGGMALTPRASLAWRHAFGDVTPASSLAFANTDAAFGVAGLPLARDTALVEAGLDLRIDPRAAVGISYSGELASGAQDHSVKGNFVWRF